MKFVPAAFEHETLDFESLEKDAEAKARQRRKAIMKSDKERDAYQFSPNESMSQDVPGIPIDFEETPPGDSED